MPTRTSFSVSFLAIFLLPFSSCFADSLSIHGNLLYDADRHFYWTTNAAMAGKMTWQGANDWIDALNNSKYGGYADWRLPYTPDGTWGYDGGNDAKYNVTVSELGQLYYNTLNLASKQHQAPNTIEELAAKTSPLEPFLLPDCYWFGSKSDMLLGGMASAWAFDFGYGAQFLQTTNSHAYAIAVRSAAPVPEPSSVVLFFTGLLILFRIRSSSDH
ncbi:protein of unknown function DUF1555 [Desulfobulbus propionicus DSM 2032]|uniref:PEP-CTERM protein-sorting domain-containing protein n=1 Tax=Desulfobulbus propionicus (strain ATCC 33891 / DSM 2032 / VKM B-1956 / 1pr3) TaxID=577650 RepID=A0A7U3YJI4_DESPD|nr:DUF1566 domain-containing protein [Desulfobulbus propionicus]ADW16543.1 protein of unknown function DUF1555 [Desulfobulbus propionicus DSM 2032]